MDIYEKCFFDVNGYLVVEDILLPDRVLALSLRQTPQPRLAGRLS